MMRGGSLTGLGAGTHSPSLCQIHVQGKQDGHCVIVESANRVHHVQNFKCGEDFLFLETSMGANRCRGPIECKVNAIGTTETSLTHVSLDLKHLDNLRILYGERIEEHHEGGLYASTSFASLDVLDAPRDTEWATALYTTRSGLDIYISIRVVHEDTTPAVRNARPANNRRSFPRQPPGASSSGGTAAASGGRFSSGMSSSDPLPEACVSCWGAGPLIDTFGCRHSYNCERCSTRMKESGAGCRACYTAKTSPPTGGTAAASGGRFSSGSGSGAAAGGSSSSSRPAASRAEEEKLLCVVCMVSAPNRRCVPCNHQIYCMDCAAIMLAEELPCAICRADVTDISEA
jgi:hypothetical protein